MSIFLPVVGYVGAALFLGFFAPYGDAVVRVGIWPFMGLGLYLALVMGLRRYFYSTVFFAFHVGFTGFVCYVYLQRHEVLPEPSFVFSAFTDENLQLAIWVLCLSTLAIFFPWFALAGRTASMSRLSLRAVVAETIGRLDSIGFVWVHLLLLGSFAGSVLLFLTNASVLDVSYPYQLDQQWLPEEVFKIPILLSTVALAIVYAKRISRQRRDIMLMNIARFNFLFVNVLSVLLAGGRGLFTFLVLIIGTFEFFLCFRRKGSLPWGALFIFLAWFAYQSWPYMRWSLALTPFNDVVSEAFLVCFGMGDQSGPTVAYAGLRLSDIGMFSASMFHLLYVEQLIRDGISLDGASFVNLLPQALPSWLDGVLWKRPLNDNWLLAEHYHHGGGFLVVANAYWNGGIWVAELAMAALSFIFVGYDRYLANPRAGMIYRVAYWLWLPIMVVQIGYGLQGMIRVVELLGAAMIFEHLLSRRHAVGLRPKPSPL